MEESRKVGEPLSDASSTKGERQHADPQRNSKPAVDKKKRGRPVGATGTGRHGATNTRSLKHFWKARNPTADDLFQVDPDNALEEFVEIEAFQTKCKLPKTPDNKITKENEGEKNINGWLTGESSVDSYDEEENNGHTGKAGEGSENGEEASGNNLITEGSNNEDREKEKETGTAIANIVEPISYDSSLSSSGKEEESREDTGLRPVQEMKEKNLQEMVTEWKEQWERTWRTAVREEAKEVLKEVREKLHEKERQNECLGEDLVKYQAQMYVEQAN